MAEQEDLPVQPGLVIPAAELTWSVSRSGGPGGQNVNKLSTRVSLRWALVDSQVLNDALRARLTQKLATRLTKRGEIVLHVDSSRSQLDNRHEARRRLAELVRDALKREKKRRPTRPTLGSKKRRLASKKQRGDTKRMRRRPPGDD
jgi:ribosome-associated protein